MASIASADGPVDRPEILLLSLIIEDHFDKNYLSLLDNLHKSTQVKRAITASGAINYLQANNPKSILVTDDGLTKKENRAVVNKVVSYVHNGGLVVVGLLFPSLTRMDVFDKFFNETFGLPWQHGNYHRSDFQFNPACSLPAGVASNSLPAPYSMKVLHVKNARPHEKIFIPTENAMTQSHVIPPGHVDQAQAAVVGAKLGNGYLVYVGDVNGETGTDRIIQSLLCCSG